MYEGDWQRITHHLYGGLARTGYDQLHNQVDDCTQEAFEVLWRKRESLVDRPNVDAWLYKTADNKLFNAYQKLKTQTKHAVSYFDENGVVNPVIDRMVQKHNTEAQSKAYQQSRLDAIEAAIGTENYDILIKYYDKHISIEELAAELGITPAALRMRVKRMLDTLRREKKMDIFSLCLLYFRLLHK